MLLTGTLHPSPMHAPTLACLSWAVKAVYDAVLDAAINEDDIKLGVHGGVLGALLLTVGVFALYSLYYGEWSVAGREERHARKGRGDAGEQNGRAVGGGEEKSKGALSNSHAEGGAVGVEEKPKGESSEVQVV